jgi:hypothetical protein
VTRSEERGKTALSATAVLSPPSEGGVSDAIPPTRRASSDSDRSVKPSAPAVTSIPLASQNRVFGVTNRSKGAFRKMRMITDLPSSARA